MPTTDDILRPVRFSFEAPAALLNLNDRLHWAQRKDLVATWRSAAWAAAHQERQRHPKLYANLGPSVVSITLPVAGNRRRDPHNFIATVKPIIDGFTDAKFWPDDSAEWVSVAEPGLAVTPRSEPKLVQVSIWRRR